MNEIILKIGFALIAGIIFSFIFSWPVYMLWNGCLVGAVEGVKEVTWLQAWGLNVLAGFFFKTNIETKK